MIGCNQYNYDLYTPSDKHTKLEKSSVINNDREILELDVN